MPQPPEVAVAASRPRPHLPNGSCDAHGRELTLLIGTEMKTWWHTLAGHPRYAISILAVTVVVSGILVVMMPPLPVALGVIVLGASALAILLVALSDGRRRSLLMDVGTGSAAPEAARPELHALEQELDRLVDPRPSYQLYAIGQKRDNLIAVLGRRLQVGELTYARYRSTAERVYLAVVSNLREVSVAKQSISTIDADYVESRLRELQVEDGGPAQAEISTLQERRDLVASQDAKVAYLLAENESAMTLLDRTATALADAPIGLPAEDSTAAMDALRELTERAQRYATT